MVDSTFLLKSQAMQTQTLNVMQAVLEEFGFGGPLSRLASFIRTSPHFAAVLSSKIYPVLYPTGCYAVYQTWW